MEAWAGLGSGAVCLDPPPVWGLHIYTAQSGMAGPATKLTQGEMEKVTCRLANLCPPSPFAVQTRSS